MSQRFLDQCRPVGYDFSKQEKTELIVSLSDKMAQKMIADGWEVGHDEEVLGYFIVIAKEE